MGIIEAELLVDALPRQVAVKNILFLFEQFIKIHLPGYLQGSCPQAI
jgi:hypothetical protein